MHPHDLLCYGMIYMVELGVDLQICETMYTQLSYNEHDRWNSDDGQLVMAIFMQYTPMILACHSASTPINPSKSESDCLKDPVIASTASRVDSKESTIITDSCS